MRKFLVSNIFGLRLFGKILVQVTKFQEQISENVFFGFLVYNSAPQLNGYSKNFGPPSPRVRKQNPLVVGLFLFKRRVKGSSTKGRNSEKKSLPPGVPAQSIHNSIVQANVKNLSTKNQHKNKRASPKSKLRTISAKKRHQNFSLRKIWLCQEAFCFTPACDRSR